MKDELMILLGCGLTALLVTNACSSMYSDKENEQHDGEQDYEHDEYTRRNRNNDYDYDYENFSNSPVLPTPSVPKTTEKFSVDYYTEPKKETVSDSSPLFFGGLVSNEPYIESDYIEMKDYTSNPDQVKVYNEKDGSIGLPVTDMTDISPGENNKYVYDRTIGTIGFTSTKIGGRFRGQADYIRGDLAIIPNKTGWFQVPSDPANKLMVGAINVENGIGNNASASSSRPAGAANAQGVPETLDSLIAKQDRYNAATSGSTGNRNFSMSGQLPPAPNANLSVQQLIDLSLKDGKQNSAQRGI